MKKILIAFLTYSLALQSNPQDAARLVNLADVMPTIEVECVYATYRNFTGQAVYKEPKCYLLKEVAAQLQQVQKELNQQGLGLLIWDAYRPMEAQKKFWELFPDDRYVAPPAMGGRHTRGTTVDLTIIKLSNKQPLDMGTGFDVFLERAWSDNQTISDEAKKNRALLKTVMAKHGFEQLKTEWWHFDYKGWQQYPPLDVSFDELN